MSLKDKRDVMVERFNSYLYWVDSFIEEPTRQKKNRVNEKQRMFCAVKNDLNNSIKSTMCGWADDTRTSKKNV